MTFDQISTAELEMLRGKLYSAGHRFAAVANELGKEGLALPPLSQESDDVWARRALFCGAMTDMYDMAQLTETGPAELFGTPYERAADRFERISRNYAKIVAAARDTIQWADDEYQAASAALAEFESSPGIPKPEYRRHPIAPDPERASQLRMSAGFADAAPFPGEWSLDKPALSVQIND